MSDNPELPAKERRLGMKEMMRSIGATVLVPAAVMLGIAIAPSSAAAQTAKSYTEITQAMFDNCIKPPTANGNKTSEGWAEYNPNDENEGEVVLKGQVFLLGTVTAAKLDFLYDPAEKVLKYTNLRDLIIGATQAQIWKGFDATMKKCKN